MPQVPTKRIIVRVFSPDGSRVVIGDQSSDLQLDIEFACRMSTKPQRNTAGIRIINLAESTRNALTKAVNTDLGFFESATTAISTTTAFDTPTTQQFRATLANGQAYCTVDAGEDQYVGRVFEGSVESLRSRQNGAEWVTELEISDGQATAGKMVDQTWPARSQLYDVVRFITQVMGLEAGNLTRAQFLNAVGANTKSILVRPLTIKRSADRILSEIFKLTGADWWTDRGGFYVVRKGQPLVDNAIVLTQEQGGLRAAPEQLDKSAVAITSDFRRGMRAGRKTVVQLGQVRTEYRAEQVNHVLSTRGGDFGSVAILRLIPKVGS